MHWVTLFDIEQSGFKDWWPLCFVAVFMAAMGFLALAPNDFYRRLLDRLPHHMPRPGLSNSSRRFFGGAGFALALLFAVSAGRDLYLNYRALRDARETGAFRVVEGRVDDYRCCKDVSFEVDGVAFMYSSDVLTSAFNDDGGMFDPGGPVKAGMRVRIAYVDRRNSVFYARQIVRVEVLQ